MTSYLVSYFHSCPPAVYLHRIRVTLKTYLCSEPFNGFSVRTPIQELRAAHKAFCDLDSLASLTSLLLSLPTTLQGHERPCCAFNGLGMLPLQAFCHLYTLYQEWPSLSCHSPPLPSSLLRCHLFREAFLNHLF